MFTPLQSHTTALLLPASRRAGDILAAVRRAASQRQQDRVSDGASGAHLHLPKELSAGLETETHPSAMPSFWHAVWPGLQTRLVVKPIHAHADRHSVRRGGQNGAVTVPDTIFLRRS